MEVEQTCHLLEREHALLPSVCMATNVFWGIKISGFFSDVHFSCFYLREISQWWASVNCMAFERVYVSE